MGQFIVLTASDHQALVVDGFKILSAVIEIGADMKKNHHL
jgi:hypothetical protein